MRRCLFALALMLMTAVSGAKAQDVTGGANTSSKPFIEARSPGGIAFLSRFDGTAADAAISFGWRDGAPSGAQFRGTVQAPADNLAAALTAATAAL